MTLEHRLKVIIQLFVHFTGKSDQKQGRFDRGDLTLFWERKWSMSLHGEIQAGLCTLEGKDKVEIRHFLRPACCLYSRGNSSLQLLG